MKCDKNISIHVVTVTWCNLNRFWLLFDHGFRLTVVSGVRGAYPPVVRPCVVRRRNTEGGTERGEQVRAVSERASPISSPISSPLCSAIPLLRAPRFPAETPVRLVSFTSIFYFVLLYRILLSFMSCLRFCLFCCTLLLRPFFLSRFVTSLYFTQWFDVRAFLSSECNMRERERFWFAASRFALWSFSLFVCAFFMRIPCVQ